MKRRAVIAIVLLAACSSEKDARPRQSIRVSNIKPDSTATRIAVTPNPRSANPCQRTGFWAKCSLERRLKQSGFVVTSLGEQPLRAGFSVKPQAYSLGKTRLEAFFYESEREVLKDVQSIDTLTVAPKGSAGAWPSPPMLLRSANLAVVVLGQDARQSERVMLAITAGPPQPNTPR